MPALGEIDVMVVHTLARWSRNLRDIPESMAVLGKHGVGLVSISENIDCERRLGSTLSPSRERRHHFPPS